MRSVSVSTGALIVVGMRWIDRLIGFVSTVILARLLVPEDFGIIAMAAIIVGLADVLLDVGVNVTLIQNSNATQEDYDAAWTLRLIQSVLSALLVLAAAGPAAEYFGDPRLTSVIQALALSLLLAGCENIGVISFQKKMEFGIESRFILIKRLSGAVITVGAAWLLHSYWALVIGSLSGRVIGVGLSYAMHPMRPRLSFIRMKSMLSFSTWNLLRGIAGFLNDNLHRFFVGGRGTTAEMGHYSLGSDIAAMPSTELLAPLSRVLISAMRLVVAARSLYRLSLVADTRRSSSIWVRKTPAESAGIRATPSGLWVQADNIRSPMTADRMVMARVLIRWARFVGRGRRPERIPATAIWAIIGGPQLGRELNRGDVPPVS
jgi:O-antigen/teichoic acid export membrane protein